MSFSLCCVVGFVSCWWVERRRQTGQETRTHVSVAPATPSSIAITAATGQFSQISAPANIAGEPASHTAEARAREEIEREVALYPQHMLGAAGVTRVILCRNLTRDNAAVGGVFDYENGIVYLNCSDVSDLHQFCWKLHHELFHAFEYGRRREFAGGQWTSLNPTGFDYPSASSTTDVFNGAAGFVSTYAMTDEIEDRAETFSCLMVDPDLIAARAETDPVIRAKVQWIKAFVRSVCPEADDSFWQRVREHRERERSAGG
jgi:hypothetical protein